MASLHFPELFKEKLDDIPRLKSPDGTIKFPVKNQLVLASFAILEYYNLCSDIYSKSNSTIRDYNEELKKLYMKYQKNKTFSADGRDIPRSWIST